MKRKIMKTIDLLMSFGRLILSLLWLLFTLVVLGIAILLKWAVMGVKWAVLAILALGKWGIVILLGIVVGGTVAFIIANAVWNIL